MEPVVKLPLRPGSSLRGAVGKLKVGGVFMMDGLGPCPGPGPCCLGGVGGWRWGGTEDRCVWYRAVALR